MGSSTNGKKVAIESDNEQARNEIEILRTRFISGNKYEGTWNAAEKTGIGTYVTSHGVAFDGEFRDGMLHGHGTMYWPRGQIMDNTWNRGKMEERRYIFADGLSYEEERWEYCKFPDRRFYKSILKGLGLGSKLLKTNDQPTKVIPICCYDVGDGIFDPFANYVTSYRDNRKIIRIPTKTESTWIKENCRKGWSEPVGYRTWLHEYWQSDIADFPTLPPKDETENWWQRLTKFTRTEINI